MSAREYPQNKSGAVRAFEDAYAKEEFLRRSAENPSAQSCTGKATPDTRLRSEETSLPAHPENEAFSREITERRENSPCASDETGKPSEKSDGKDCPLKKLFGFSDGGDLLLFLLIVFFLTDNDSENDKLIPILLAVLLFL